MSPLAIWATSCASTASISSWVMFCNKPVETATKAEFLKAPVAKALGSPSKIPTSGMPMPDLSASFFTVSTNHFSSALLGCAMTCTPELHLATGLLMSKEMKAPPKPMMRAKPNKAVKSKPLEVRKRLTPNTLATTPNTNTTARLVSTNKIMRFMRNSDSLPSEGQAHRLNIRGGAHKIKCAALIPQN